MKQYGIYRLKILRKKKNSYKAKKRILMDLGINENNIKPFLMNELSIYS